MSRLALGLTAMITIAMLACAHADPRRGTCAEKAPADFERLRASAENARDAAFARVLAKKKLTVTVVPVHDVDDDTPDMTPPTPRPNTIRLGDMPTAEFAGDARGTFFGVVSRRAQPERQGPELRAVRLRPHSRWNAAASRQLRG